MLLACFSACAAPWFAAIDGSAQALLPAELQAIALIDGARAQRTVRELVALGPRMGGTASGRRSAEYVAQRFAASGLAVRQIRDPEIWCYEHQRFTLAVREDTSATWRELERAWPVGFSAAGRGTLALSLEPRAEKACLSRDRPRPTLSPAPALYLCDGLSTLDGRWPVIQSFSKARAPTWPAFSLSREDGDLLRAWMDRGRAVEVSYELETTIERAAPITVEACLRGWQTSAADERPFFLFCAHGDSDSGGPGANDNASGVAILLEIAQAWSSAREQGLFAPLECDVRFVVFGAEIHSSANYLRACYAKPQTILGLINFDQSGFGSSDDRLHVEPDDVPANRALIEALAALLAGAQQDPPAATAAAPQAAELPARAVGALAQRFPSRWSTNKSLGGTDSYVFSDSTLFQERGLPAVTLYASAWGRPAEHARTDGMPGESFSSREKVAIDYDVNYHSAGDLPATSTDLEPWNMEWCARVGWLAAWRFLRAQGR